MAKLDSRREGPAPSKVSGYGLIPSLAVPGGALGPTNCQR
jgi:hypothetical protein